MVAMYTVFGRQIGSHWLAMATLGTVFGGSWAAMRGRSKEPSRTPPMNAQSKDEEQFIQEFMKNVEAEDKKAKA